MPLLSGLASGVTLTPLITMSFSSETGMRSAIFSDTALEDRFSTVTTKASCIWLRCLPEQRGAAFLVQSPCELELIGDAEEQGKLLSVGDEVEVRHAEERPRLIERDAPGQ